MRSLFWSLFAAVIALTLFAGCASSYQALSYNDIAYSYAGGDSSIVVQYEPRLLTGNYQRNELKAGVNLVAVKITNNTTHQIIPKTSLKPFSGAKQMNFLPIDNLYDAAQQNPDKYYRLLFLLPANVYYSEEETYRNQVTSRKVRFYPVGLVIAPPLAFGNRGHAKKANKRFQQDLKDNSILETVIKPGQTVSGLLAVDNYSPDDLNFEVIH